MRMWHTHVRFLPLVIGSLPICHDGGSRADMTSNHCNQHRGGSSNVKPKGRMIRTTFYSSKQPPSASSHTSSTTIFPWGKVTGYMDIGWRLDSKSCRILRPFKTFVPVEFSDVKVVLPIVDAIFAMDTRMPFLLDRLCVNMEIDWIYKMESVVDHEV